MLKRRCYGRKKSDRQLSNNRAKNIDIQKHYTRGEIMKARLKRRSWCSTKEIPELEENSRKGNLRTLYGLRARYLRKHGKGVARFFRRLSGQVYRTETAARYQRRFEKNRQTLFTFLEHDGVSWNNSSRSTRTSEVSGKPQLVRVRLVR